MSSEKIASAVNILKGNLAASWDILSGSQGESERLNIANRFGGSAAAYSLRDIGGIGNRTVPNAVIKVRRDNDDTTQDFSANQVATGQVEAFVGSGNNGFVTIWYDQSGNKNDAAQATKANQPKIVNSGTLLTDGLLFDGTNDFLQTSTQVLTGTETGSNGIYAVVKVTSGDSGYVAGSASDNSGSDKVGQSIYADGATSNKFILTNGSDANSTNFDNITITESAFCLISACYNNNSTNTLQKNSSTSGYSDGSSAYNFNAGTKFTIGHRERSSGVVGATMLNGSLKEIIAFDIDTTSDRSEIQADIINYYGL